MVFVIGRNLDELVKPGIGKRWLFAK